MAVPAALVTVLVVVLALFAAGAPAVDPETGSSGVGAWSVTSAPSVTAIRSGTARQLRGVLGQAAGHGLPQAAVFGLAGWAAMVLVLLGFAASVDRRTRWPGAVRLPIGRAPPVAAG
jgi:hypothetical protein